MKFFAALVVAATAVLAQQQEGNQGPNLSEGPSAVSNPNVNNGFQAQGSFFDGSQSGGNQISGQVGSSFNHQASNSAILDSNFINPSKSSVSGNVGDTANGEGNSIGDFFGAGGFIKRDAVLNNFGGFGGFGGYGGHAYGAHYAPVAYAPRPVVYEAPRPIAYAAPRPIAYAAPHPVAYAAPIAHPAYAAPVSSYNHNVQQAGIVQNQL
ncbi:hypothetical protein IW140_005284 [Coemansia sp. RSA 1813]|nr:hypothetical protein EV178_005776 [Coemansia sp. RSA 1646]KAJ1768784.1 hypothetical protein LPJ74_004584 [Coemansia sp. RSA 1843]KAJ2086375.1 hypothetical protein IW138_005746 [Coemansia sp. RSA 986]KAJ2212300.1 hypothetical protein EV179_004770 [Coemansia sp. RSA 487]KAJ2565595.1 hypothetical protein IW140_005284 [Coemansia sp. RSA 1813]